MIAACLITKDSEATLERCLQSIRPHVDGVFIYDTGSTDGTVELLEELDKTTTITVEAAALCADCLGSGQSNGGPCPHCDATGRVANEIPLAPVTVQRGEWRDDFAWAREQSFAMPGPDYDWLLWLDDDDVVEGAEHLRRLAHTADPDTDGFVLFYEYARDEAGNCVCQLWRERLIRRASGFRWQGTVHEVLAHPDGRTPAFVPVPPDMARYVHHRPDGRYQPDRNLRLLQAEHDAAIAAGQSPTPRCLAYLGTETMAQGDFAAAVPWLAAYLDHPDARWPDERAQVRHKLATCLRAIGHVHASVEAEFEALREKDDWSETYVGLAEAFAILGEWARCERWARRALELGMPNTTLILNPMEFRWLPLLRLSEACVNTGRYEEAQRWLDQAARITPGHQVIEERRAAYAQARLEGEITGAYMLLYQTLVRFDENEKALRLVEECAPYVIQHRPEVAHARAAQRENCRHLTDPGEYRRWYAEEPKESLLPDELVPQAATLFHRVALLEQGLEEQERELGRKPSVLDLGCNDFWLGAYLLTRGYRVDGLELNRSAHTAAVERAARFRNGGPPPTVAHGDLHDAPRILTGRYDAVSLFEVLEHVPDPDAALRVCERMVTPGGRVYVSTPDGAYEAGNLPRWDVVERKGHLRAWPAVELAERLNRRGNVRVMDLGQGLTVAGYTPGRKRGRVVFYAGGCFERWAPNQAHTSGLGGSETALVQVATRLALAGWEVKVFADTDPAMTAGGVIWRPHTGWDPSEECDAMIVSRLPEAFAQPIRAPVRALWCHDHSYPAMTEELAGRMTHVVVLSEWQRQRFRRLYPYLEDRLVLIRNGVTVTGPDGTDRFPDGDAPFAERKPRCVYASSADRGLDTLLELWPRIRAQAPEAELHVFYGFDMLDRAALRFPHLATYKQRVLGLVAAAGGEAGGVFLRGRIPQPELYRELQEARVWSYPTGFLETSCIGAMEARAAGLAIVTSGLAALTETVGRHGRLIPWTVEQVCAGQPPVLSVDEIEASPVNTTARYGDAFVREVAAALTDEARWQALHERARSGADGLDWQGRMPGWERLIGAGRPRRRARARAAVAA